MDIKGVLSLKRNLYLGHKFDSIPFGLFKSSAKESASAWSDSSLSFSVLERSSWQYDNCKSLFCIFATHGLVMQIRLEALAENLQIEVN